MFEVFAHSADIVRGEYPAIIRGNCQNNRVVKSLQPRLSSSFEVDHWFKANEAMNDGTT